MAFLTDTFFFIVRIHTFMDEEVFAVFLVNETVIAMRAFQDSGF